MSAIQSDGPRLANVATSSNQHYYPISGLLDELDMMDKQERRQFTNFLKEYLSWDERTKQGYTREEHFALPDSHMPCYATQFLDSATIEPEVPTDELQKSTAGRFFFPRPHLDVGSKFSQHPKEWSYAEHRDGIIVIVSAIMITQKRNMGESVRQKRVKNKKASRKRRDSRRNRHAAFRRQGTLDDFDSDDESDSYSDFSSNARSRGQQRTSSSISRQSTVSNTSTTSSRQPAASHNTAPPNTASTNPSPPDTASTNTASPNTASTNTASTNAASPNTASPNTASTNTASTNAASPNTASPNTASTNTVSTDAASPNTASPNTTSTNTASTNAASPNTAAPNTASTNNAAPNTASTDTAFTNTASPNTASPDAASTHSSAPTQNRPTENQPTIRAVQPTSNSDQDSGLSSSTPTGYPTTTPDAYQHDHHHMQAATICPTFSATLPPPNASEAETMRLISKIEGISYARKLCMEKHCEQQIAARSANGPAQARLMLKSQGILDMVIALDQALDEDQACLRRLVGA